MATSRRVILVWSMTTSIAVGFLVFLLLSIFTPAPDQLANEVVDESDIQFFLRCMRLVQLYQLPREQFDSHRDKWDAIACHDIFRLLQFTYQDNGQLPPGYKEALLVWNKNNQTIVDIEICGLDYGRCSNQTKALSSRYYDELACSMREELCGREI